MADPPINDNTFNYLEQSNDHKKKLYIGATGWVAKEWVGTYYPTKTKSVDYLHNYTEQFNTIELNTTFYRMPDEMTILKWYNQSTIDFKFCPKVFQYISQSRLLGSNNSEIEQFISVVALLAEKLGPSFLQLPPTFSPVNIGALIDFLERIEQKIPIAIEFRHPDWFNEKAISVFDDLRKLNVSSVITDVAGRRDVCHMQVTNSDVMIRFVGNNLVSSDYVRIIEWIDRLIYWFDMGVRNIYFFVHEPENIHAPVLANYMGQEWKKRSSIDTRYPKIIENTKEQLSLFKQ
jgi:uncharacterized protein YecE (DUF72 family)